MSRNSSPVHKRNFALATDADGIIDLCSPVHTKPCRKQTPIINAQPNPTLSSTAHLKSSVATSLFQDCNKDLVDVLQSRGHSLLTMEDDDDGYWEPAGYASSHEHGINQDGKVGSKDVGEENSLYRLPQNNDLVIDLCSPASSKPSPLKKNAYHFAGPSPSALDQTLHSSDEEEGSEEDASDSASSDKYTAVEPDLETRTYTSLSDRLAARRVMHSSSQSQSQYTECNFDTISVHSTSSQVSHTSSVAPVRAASPPMSLFSQVMRNATSLHNYSSTTGTSSSYTEKSMSCSHTMKISSSNNASSSSNISSQISKGSSLRSKFLAVEQSVLGKHTTTANNNTTTTTATSSSATATIKATTTAPSSEEVTVLDDPNDEVPTYRLKPFLPSDFNIPRSALGYSAPPATDTMGSAMINTTSVTANTPAVRKASTSSILRRAESVSVQSTSFSTGNTSSSSSGVQSSSAITASTLYRANSLNSALAIDSTSYQGAKVTSTYTQSSSVGNSVTATTNPDGTFRSRYSEKSLGALPTLPSDCHWQVLLLIDKRERCNELIQTNMAARNIPCQLSTLAVGDFLWVIRPVTAAGVPATIASSMLATTLSTATATTSTTTIAATSSTNITIDENSNSAHTRKGKASKTTSTKAQSKITSFITESQSYTNDEDTQMSAVSALGEEEENNEISDPVITTRTYVLDCIAERKSIADLASSMCDGRYNEQKARLKACNLRSTMYIVEGEHIVVSQHQKAISSAHIKTAMISINVDSGMHVLRTRSMDHTITCLQNLHRQVERRFQKQLAEGTAQYQTFGEFQSMYSKKAAATNRQLFGHQLRQIQGCSTSVALTLMNKYGTTARFMYELKILGWTKAQYTLENVVNEVTKRRLGKAVATRICQIYLTTF